MPPGHGGRPPALSITAPGEIVNGGVEAQEDGAVSLKGTQTLGDFVADVAGVDVGEDKGVGIAGYLRVGWKLPLRPSSAQKSSV